jgi:hypothetical protein
MIDAVTYYALLIYYHPGKDFSWGDSITKNLTLQYGGMTNKIALNVLGENNFIQLVKNDLVFKEDHILCGGSTDALRLLVASRNRIQRYTCNQNCISEEIRQEFNPAVWIRLEEILTAHIERLPKNNLTNKLLAGIV